MIVRRSKYTRELLAPIVAKHLTIVGVLRELGIVTTGGSSNYIRDKIRECGIDTSHMTGRRQIGPANPAFRNGAPIDALLVVNSSYHRGHLKTRLLGAGLITNVCAICGQADIWRDAPLTLVLDHINGVNNDNRLDNLRMLCPNCNSQQPTFCRGVKRKKVYRCPECSGQVSNRAGRCNRCAGLLREKDKIDKRPSLVQLELDMTRMTMLAIGKKYGVSDTTVRKWIKRYKAAEVLRASVE